MYPASLYPGATYPGAIFPGPGKAPGGPGAPAGPTGQLGLYPGSLFPASLFPPSLFPGSAGPLPTGPIPDDLVDAVVARIRARLVLAGSLTWFGTGPAPSGAGSARPGPDLPYAQLGEPDEDDSWWTTSADQLATGHLAVSCYAATKKAARLAGDRVAAALNDAPLAFSAGVLVYLRQSARTATLDPDPAPGGGDCWVEARQFKFLYSCNTGS